MGVSHIRDDFFFGPAGPPDLMAYEVTKDLPTEPYPVETPLEPTTGARIMGKKLALKARGPFASICV